MTESRGRQLAYSEMMASMLDEYSRRTKAEKMVRVLQHYLGVQAFDGLFMLDVGCSAGFTCERLRAQGADVLGLDIDEPGLRKAQERFGDRVLFLCADGEQLPLPAGSVDAIILNHIYEHVIDPDAVMSELRRVLKPDGALYLALGNRLGIMEPHYRLPFLSWLPRRLAHRYVRATGRADHYHEQFRTRRGLRRLVHPLVITDYTWTVIAEPERFHATDIVPAKLAKVPVAVLKLAAPLVPTYIWVASHDGQPPRGQPVAQPPKRVSSIGPDSRTARAPT